MNKFLSALLVAGSLSLALAGLASYASASTLVPSPSAGVAITPAPLFFSTIPASGGAQAVRVEAGGRAWVTIASLTGDVPLAVWKRAGWQVGRQIGAAEDVPADCALHPRQGVTGQLYGQCLAGAVLAVPNEGADFIYVVLTDENHVIKKTLQTGRLLVVDTTGLIP